MEIMNPKWAQLSPLFHYYVTRFEDGGANADGFLYLDNGLVTLTTSGVCVRSLHSVPFTTDGAATKPSPGAYADGQSRALGKRGGRVRYREVDVLSRVVWIREQLKQNCPVIIGVQLPTNYPGSFLNSRSEWLDPDQAPRSATGHCVLVTGYDDTRGALHIQDCAGTHSFASGYWWMGYRVADSTIVQQVYCLIP
jgi:hypothetical protein